MTNKNSKGFAPLIVLLAVVLVASFGVAVYNQEYVSQSTQKVLGREDSSDDSNKDSDDSKDDEYKSEDGDGKNVESTSSTQKPESTRKPEFRKLETPKPAKTLEPETEEAEDATDSGKEYEYEIRNETQNGVTKVKIKNGDNQFEMEQEGIKLKVQSNFPISVDTETNTLTVTTPQGDKNVAILPQKAIDNMVSAGFLSTPSNLELKSEDNGGVSYKIEGSDTKKLLGLFSVSIPKTVIVSANSGLVVDVQQSFASRLLNFFSTQ